MSRAIVFGVLLAGGIVASSTLAAAPSAPATSPATPAPTAKAPAPKTAAKPAKAAPTKVIDAVNLDDLAPVLAKGGFTTAVRQQGGASYLEAQLPDAPGLGVIVQGLGCVTPSKCQAFGMLVVLNPSAITSDIRKRVGAEVHYVRIITLQDTPVFAGDYLVAGGVTEQNIAVDIQAFMLGLAQLGEIVRTEGQSADNSAPGPANPVDAFARVKQAFASATAPKIFANDPALTAKIVADVASMP